MPSLIPAVSLLTGLIAMIVIAAAPPVIAQPTDTTARSALVVDLTSGAVLLDKNADAPMPPASMSKLMTLLMVFEALDEGRLSPDDTFRTSSRAAAMGGSKMFIRDGEIVSVIDLVRGVIVQSGNDAAVALAEALAGTEEAFAERMNGRAAELGLTGSHFVNATGWPHPEERMTPRDLVLLAEILITEHPELYKMFAETEFTWDGIEQKNRNPLLYLGVGADGLKTGHTEEAGYGLVASAKRGNRRVVMVIAGLEGAGDRRQEAERLINWAFRAFETRSVFSAGQAVADAPVWIGDAATVPLAPARDVTITAPFGALDDATVAVHYRGPISAPIDEGAEIGHIEITVPGIAPVKVPLVATNAVATGGVLARMQAAAELLMLRILPSTFLE